MIFTFGYGNRKSYDQLSSYIEDNNIEYLIDVRIKPRAWSRRWYGQQISNFCLEKNQSFYFILSARDHAQKWISSSFSFKLSAGSAASKLQLLNNFILDIIVSKNFD